MTKNLLSIILIILIFLNYSSLLSQKQEPSAKMLHIDAGYGAHELSLGVGFKYTLPNFPFSVGPVISLTGFTTTIPHYGYKDQTVKNFDLEKYATFVVCGDANLYYEWREFSIFGTIGFYSQADTVLAKTITGNYTNYYYERTESVSGLTYGLGLAYYFNDIFSLGIAYQNKKGVYLQLGYTWY